MKTLQKYSPEVKEHSVRLVLEHQIDFTAQTLHLWGRQAEQDQGSDLD